MSSSSIVTKPLAERLDDLIERGLRRAQTENQNTTIADYIRLLQLSPEAQADDNTENTIIWVDNLDEYELPEAA